LLGLAADDQEIATLLQPRPERHPLNRAACAHVLRDQLALTRAREAQGMKRDERLGFCS
jgi:hypothetical protein